MTNNENVLAEDAGDKTPASNAPDKDPEQQQTVEIPISAFPTPPKPNATVQLRVISVDANGGIVNAVVMEPEGPGGSDSLAAEFNQPSGGSSASDQKPMRYQNQMT
jgi:hypothetical protein